jgi:iron(III) transport system substrate-binding protein
MVGIMGHRSRLHAIMFAVTVGAACVSATPRSSATDLPKATVKLLAELELSPDILAGLDQELAVPQEWIEGAKKEGGLRMGATWDPPQYRKMTEAFAERYPFIKHDYSRGNRQDRTLKPLMAFQSGRSTVDVIVGLGATFAMFKEAGALVDMRGLPNWDKVLDGRKDDEGLWVGQRVAYWCIAYNTDKMKVENLPKAWDDLLGNPAWSNGQLALTNRPNLWFASLWSVEGNGEAWGKRYATRLFREVKPQLRKEGNNALLALLAAGEFAAVVPASPARLRQYQKKGAPISWHCPEPVPLSVSELGIMKNNPNPYASLLWVNWFLSKEGQIAQFNADKSPPVHKDLQIEVFLPFPEQIVGRKIAFRDHTVLERDLPEVFAVWNPLWEQAAQN